MTGVLIAPCLSAYADTVWVHRTDAGKSCDPGSAESLEAGAAELAGAHVPVLDSKKGSDGKMHIQVCGAPTGTSNSYLIPKDDLDRAEELGYRTDTPTQKKSAKRPRKKKQKEE